MQMGLHQHYKGAFYKVLHLAANANSHEMERGALTVVYQCEKTGQIYTRDYTEFAAGAPGTPAGERNPRFKCVANDPSIATHFTLRGTNGPIYYRSVGDKFEVLLASHGGWVPSSFGKAELESWGMKPVSELGDNWPLIVKA